MLDIALITLLLIVVAIGAPTHRATKRKPSAANKLHIGTARFC